MASINKSFNFRHGVQVDDDDFTVRGGLVGIGTTVPTERLDVRGNAVVSGLTSSISLQVTGVTTLTTVDIGITSIKSGIITASSGIVTYYGDGQYLKFLPTSQWVDIDVGLGFTSIYNTGGNVGVSTDDPRNSFQVGGDPTNLGTGVGINSDGGHIFASGIVTATSFVGEVNAPNFDTNAAGVVVSGIVTATSLQGALTGNVTGNVTGDLTGEVNSSKFDTNPSGIVVTGVATATSFVGDVTGDVTGNADSATILATARNIGGVSFNGSADINLPGVNVAGNQNTTGTAANLSGTPNISVGAVTASSLDISGGVDVDGHTDLDNVSISGVTTFAGNIDATNINATGVGTFTDIDISGTADLPNVFTSGIGTFTRSFATNLNVSGVSTFGTNIVANGNLDLAGNIDVDGMTELDDVNVSSAATIFTAQISRLNVSGVTTSTGGFVGNLTGNATGTSGGLTGTPTIVVNGLTATTSKLGVSTATSIGVGTDTANAEIQIHKPTGSSSIVIGQNSGTDDNNLELRYGGGASSYSTSDSVDLINYGDGNLNSFITGSSNFNWLKGNANILMSLTDSGNLGIGKTDPTDRLHVQGNATITGVTTFTGNVTMSNLTVPIINIADVSANLVGNVNSAGISTFRLMHIDGVGEGIGVGGTASGNFINAGNTPLNTTFVGSATTNPSRIFSREGAVGVGTDRFTHLGGGSVPSLEVRGATMIHGGFFKVGGKSSPVTSQNARSLVDFSDTINSHDATNSLAPVAYMIVPRGTTAQRNALRDGVSSSATLMTGSMFYDTDLNKLCVYDNGGWKGVTLGAL